MIGRLKEHGEARYQYRADQDVSYYVKLLTARGEKTIWGKDLERAIKEGKTRPKLGDLVGARRVAREAVTVTAKQRDAEGRVVAQQEHHAHRTRWVVEGVAFFADRARMARRLREEQQDMQRAMEKQPELRSAFLSVRAAEEFAERRIADPRDRERFLQLVKGALETSIRRGEALPSMSLRESRARKGSEEEQSPKRKPEDRTR